MKDNIKMVPALLFAAALLTGAATADAQTVAGKWEAEYPTRVRHEAGGTPHAEEMGKATLRMASMAARTIATVRRISSSRSTPARRSHHRPTQPLPQPRR